MTPSPPAPLSLPLPPSLHVFYAALYLKGLYPIQSGIRAIAFTASFSGYDLAGQRTQSSVEDRSSTVCSPSPSEPSMIA